MNVNNLKVELDPRLDSNDKIFYLGKIKFPGTIDLSEGITFLIFVADSGSEEIQLAALDTNGANFSKYSRKGDRLKINLDGRNDKYDNKFYVAKLQYNGYIDCNSEVVFIVFTSAEGSEELQIVGNIISFKEKKKQIEVEVVKRKSSTAEY